MIKYPQIIKSLFLCLILVFSSMIHAEKVSSNHNGINYPIGLKNWRVISTSFRTDNKTQRVILGNSIAIKASRAGKTKPWPKGSILAKLVWKNSQHPKWDAAIVPGEFVHSEVMIKDTEKYKTTGGWGYARWIGLSQQPYGKNKSFAQTCLSCHTKAKDSDFVFTMPAKIP